MSGTRYARLAPGADRASGHLSSHALILVGARLSSESCVWRAGHCRPLRLSGSTGRRAGHRSAGARTYPRLLTRLHFLSPPDSLRSSDPGRGVRRTSTYALGSDVVCRLRPAPIPWAVGDIRRNRRPRGLSLLKSAQSTRQQPTNLSFCLLGSSLVLLFPNE